MLKIAYVSTEAMTDKEFESLLPHISEERRLFLENCRSKKNRYNSVVAECLARYMLAEVSGIPAQAFNFTRQKFGKPVQTNREGLFFNFSHSSNLVLCAIADFELGVDVQYPAKISKGAQAKILSPLEAEYYGTAVEKLNKIWCRKESYYKYLGTGINQIPNQTDTLALEREQTCEWLEGKIEEQFLYAVCSRKLPEKSHKPERLSIDLLIDKMQETNQ